MADRKRGWQQFQKLNFDSKRLSKRVKKAETATVRHARRFIVGRLDNIRSVRRNIIAWLLLVGCMLVLVGAQMFWFQRSYQTTTAAAGGTYAEAALGSIDTLNPLYAASSSEVSASRLIFSSLYSYEETGHLRSDLAKSMNVDDTGTIYTVSLNPAAQWHDGMRVTAADVAFTVNLIKNPAARSQLQSAWQGIKVKVVDDSTVRFTLPSVIASFDHALTFAVLPKHILETIDPSSIRESGFSRSPIGSGPFSFKLLQTIDAQKQQSVLNLAAFSDYHKGQPLINRFEIHSYDSQDSILRALRTGEVNAASGLTGYNARQVDTHNYSVVTRPLHSGVYALLNVSAPILKDAGVRQALQRVTDTDKVRQGITAQTLQLDLPFVAGQLTGSDVPKVPEPNARAAASLLDKSDWKLNSQGIRTKDGSPLALRVVTTKNMEYEKALEVLAGQWRSLGVVVNIEVVDPTDPAANYAQTRQQRDYDVLLTELSIGADPDVYAYWHSSRAGMGGLNFSNYANDTADSILSSAGARLEPELRNAKYKAFAKQWISDAPAVALYQPTVDYVFNKHAMSVKPGEVLITPYDRYANVLYWSVGERSVYKTP